MAVAFGATIVLMMSHNRENVVWSAVAFLPVPIFFLSYSPLRSAVLGPFREWFKNFVVNFLMLVVMLVAMFLSFLVFIIYLVFKGLFWTVKKACWCIICKPLCWICDLDSNNGFFSRLQLLLLKFEGRNRISLQNSFQNSCISI